VRNPPRAPQSAKFLFGVSFLKLFLCACAIKEKAAEDSRKAKGKTPKSMPFFQKVFLAGFGAEPQIHTPTGEI
jgi:hypothetical protein